MGIIKVPMRFEGSKGEEYLTALFDSGATHSCIREELVDKIEQKLQLHNPLILSTASADKKIEIKYATRLDFYFDDIRLSDEFLVVPELSEEIILGVQTFQKWRIKLDFENDKVIIDPKVAKAMLV